MKKLATIFVFAFLFINSANSAEQISALSPSDSETIEVYESFKSTTPLREISRSELQLPLAILDSQNGYLKVNINNHVFWVKTAKVRIKRDVTASCGAAGSPERTVSTPGLAGNTCK